MHACRFNFVVIKERSLMCQTMGYLMQEILVIHDISEDLISFELFANKIKYENILQVNLKNRHFCIRLVWC